MRSFLLYRHRSQYLQMWMRNNKPTNHRNMIHIPVISLNKTSTYWIKTLINNIQFVTIILRSFIQKETYVLVSHFQLMVVNNGPIQQKDDFYTESSVLWHTVFAVKVLPLENISATTSGLSLKTTSFKDSDWMATYSSSSKYKWFPAHLLNIPALSKLKYRYNVLVKKLLAFIILQKENARIWGEERNSFN